MSQSDELAETSPKQGDRESKETAEARKRRKQLAERGLSVKSVQKLAENLFADDLHAATVLSLANGVIGVLHAASLAIHAIGRGLAAAAGKKSKHATKQVDRLLSNGKLHIWRLFKPWIAYVVGPRKELVVALDWTDFDGDDQM